METNKDFMDYLSENYPDSIILDGMDGAVIGIDTDGHVVYSYNKCIECFMENGEMTVLEAMECIGHNTIQAIPCMGEKHPIIMYGVENFG